MKRLIVSLFVAALCLSAQVATVPNTDFPTFRANLNTSLQNAASISGAYVNPGFITSLSFTKLFNVPLFARTDQANTWTVGAQDFSAVPHLRIPTTAGYTPTLAGHFGYDTATNTYKGFVGTVKTFAFTDSNITGNAATVTNGVVTTGSYADPTWITSLAKSKLGLASVENTALSLWAGSANITTIGTLAAGTVPWARLSGAPATYAPSAHAASHVSGGADALNGALDVSVTGSAATATTAANLSGTPALPNGTTATTQAVADNSAKLATTAYTDRAVAGVAGSNPTGTIGDTFQIGTLASGPKLKRNGTGLDLRNSGDTAYEELTVQRVKSPSGTTFEAGGLFESTPTVLIPTLFFNDAVKLPQFMDAVSAIPVGTMVKIPVLDPGNDHKVITNIPGTGDPLRQQIDCSWLSGVGTGCSGTLPVASATLPSMDGVASAGSGTGYSLPNHVHPSDTSRVPTTRTVNGQALSADITITTPRNIAVATFVGGGSALTAGSTPGVSLIYSPPVVAACTATSWTITVDAGTAGFRVWRAAAGTANPTVTESIVPSSDLAISTGTTLTSTTFTNFSNGTAPVFAVGDRIAVRLATVATATYAQFSIQCQ